MGSVVTIQQELVNMSCDRDPLKQTHFVALSRDYSPQIHARTSWSRYKNVDEEIRRNRTKIFSCWKEPVLKMPQKVSSKRRKITLGCGHVKHCHIKRGSFELLSMCTGSTSIRGVDHVHMINANARGVAKAHRLTKRNMGDSTQRHSAICQLCQSCDDQVGNCTFQN